jgi:hypothetical protein
VTWCTTKAGDEIHVYPAYEDHEMTATCWCEPQPVDEAKALPIYRHRNQEERDDPEQRSRMPESMERALAFIRAQDP